LFKAVVVMMDRRALQVLPPHLSNVRTLLYLPATQVQGQPWRQNALRWAAEWNAWCLLLITSAEMLKPEERYFEQVTRVRCGGFVKQQQGLGVWQGSTSAI
jgi:hypothetical protein